MAKDNKDQLLGKTLEELHSIASSYGWPSFRAKQIAAWVYHNRATQIDEMTNLPLEIRKQLSANYTIGFSSPAKTDISEDGTKKYLFAVQHGGFIESVYIPDGERHTLCVSSQLGCKMGCQFCMTGRHGFQGHLSALDIINQVHSLPERELLTNIVFMGMGEPMDNLDEVLKSLEILGAEYGYGMSPRRITVSTIGILPAMKTFLEKSRCHLAVSLHSPFDNERQQMMPLAKNNTLKEIIEAIRNAPPDNQRHISFEYVVFRGINHSLKHAKALARLLGAFRCHINLLRFHPIPDTRFKSPDNETMELFKKALESYGLTVTIRKSRGEDIQAACGLLATNQK